MEKLPSDGPIPRYNVFGISKERRAKNMKIALTILPIGIAVAVALTWLSWLD